MRILGDQHLCNAEANSSGGPVMIATLCYMLFAKTASDQAGHLQYTQHSTSSRLVVLDNLQDVRDSLNRASNHARGKCRPASRAGAPEYLNGPSQT
ncbi:hypothetical protein AB0D08_17530 [Kitasatospora sp. NPDC048540]|uniref:hypothetical protein n=1 Tax=unclassified Kitasatospora TaxID=2633591 RepID=UPI001E48D281|nr:hypothetical protein [Kitasatospora sp. MBT63]